MPGNLYGGRSRGYQRTTRTILSVRPDGRGAVPGPRLFGRAAPTGELNQARRCRSIHLRERLDLALLLLVRGLAARRLGIVRVLSYIQAQLRRKK